jgi:hypothetical protein
VVLRIILPKKFNIPARYLFIMIFNKWRN